MELAKEKNVHHVTVKELCAQAQVNRTTFYKHYESMQDFLDHLVDGFLSDMTTAVDQENPYVAVVSGMDPLSVFSRCVAFMDENASFLRMMFGKNGSSDFRHQIQDVWRAQLSEAFLPFARALETRTNIDILACFVSSAMMGLLEFYIRPDNRYNKTYMATQMTTLVRDGALAWALS
ncbi:MAG: TetR/AcrR family transcriptional regulator [Coriobacteriia bacterium]